MSMSPSSQEEMKRLLHLMESISETSLGETDYELNDDELSDLEHEAEITDKDYLDDEDEESEEFESGDLVRFTDDYAEPDFPDEVYTLKDWDPEKGRGWAVDEDGQGWSVQAHQIQHAYVDESLNECGCDSPEMPAQLDTQISYSKTHSIPDASVTVSASAKDHEQLQAVLRLAGVDADFAQAHMAEPEPEVDAEPEMPMSFGVRQDARYSTDAEFIRDQLRQRMKGLM